MQDLCHPDKYFVMNTYLQNLFLIELSSEQIIFNFNDINVF